MKNLFKRNPRYQHSWRILFAIFGVALFDFLINYNLAIHNTLEKIKLSADTLEWLDIFLNVEWGIADLALLGVMGVLWAIGLTRLLRLGLMWYSLSGAFTVIGSVAALIITVAFRDEDVWGLLWDAVLVWVGNIVIFASWYWLIDAEHAQANDAATPTKRWEFLFPQRAGEIAGWEHWQPRFFDYLFLAFTTATAFSPTETAPLSRRAKLLTMLQAIISLIVVAVLAARAINILKPPA